MNKILIGLLLISLTANSQEKKDSVVSKTKHRVSFSLLGELNYSNEMGLFYNNCLQGFNSGYSYSFGATINIALNKCFTIGTGIINDQFSMTYGGFDHNVYKTTSFNYFFIGIPIVPDFHFSWEKASFNFIPEIRIDELTHDIVKTQSASGEFLYNNKILILACPKIGITYNFIHSFSLSAYFGVKQTLRPITQTDMNSPFYGSQTSIYGTFGGLGINYKL